MPFFQLTTIFFILISFFSCGKNEEDPDDQGIMLMNEQLHQGSMNLLSNPNRNLAQGFSLVELGVILADGDETNPSQSDLTFYVHHPITVTATIKASGKPFNTSLHVGLMQAHSANATEDQLRQMTSCSLGSLPIVHSGAAADGSAISMTFSKSFIISPTCLPSGTSSSSFYFFVVIDEIAQLKFDHPSLDSGTTLIFGPKDKNNPLNQACLTRNQEPGCIYNLIVQSSPGLRLIMEDFKTNSSTGLIPASLNGAEDPYIQDGADEYDTPFLRSQITLRLLGASSNVEDGLDGDKKVTIQYEICPTSRGDDDATACQSSVWMPLGIYDPSKPNSPTGHRSQIDIGVLRSGEPITFEHDLYVEETLFHLMTQGSWRNESYYMVRACARPNFKEGLENLTKTDIANFCKVTSVLALRMTKDDFSNEKEINLKKDFDKRFGSQSSINVTFYIKTNSSLTADDGIKWSLISGLGLDGKMLQDSLLGFIPDFMSLQIISNAVFENAEDKTKKSGTLATLSLFSIPIYYNFKDSTETASNDSDPLSLKKIFFKEHCQGSFPMFWGMTIGACFGGSLGNNFSIITTKNNIAKNSSTLFPNAESFYSITGSGMLSYSFTLGPKLSLGVDSMSIGIKGSADVARIELPFSTGIYWGRDNTNKTTSVKADISSQLKLSTLSGSIGLVYPGAVAKIIGLGQWWFNKLPAFSKSTHPENEPNYAQLIASSYEPLFKWSGITYDVNLMKRVIPVYTFP